MPVLRRPALVEANPPACPLGADAAVARVRLDDGAKVTVYASQLWRFPELDLRNVWDYPLAYELVRAACQHCPGYRVSRQQETMIWWGDEYAADRDDPPLRVRLFSSLAELDGLIAAGPFAGGVPGGWADLARRWWAGVSGDPGTRRERRPREQDADPMAAWRRARTLEWDPPASSGPQRRLPELLRTLASVRREFVCALHDALDASADARHGRDAHLRREGCPDEVVWLGDNGVWIEGRHESAVAVRATRADALAAWIRAHGRRLSNPVARRAARVRLERTLARGCTLEVQHVPDQW